MPLPQETPLPHGSVSPSPKVPISKRLNTDFSLWGQMAIYAYPETALMGGVQRGMGVLVATQQRGRVGGSVRSPAAAPSGVQEDTENGCKRKRKTDQP